MSDNYKEPELTNEDLVRTARRVLLRYLQSSFPTSGTEVQAELALSTIYRLTQEGL